MTEPSKDGDAKAVAALTLDLRETMKQLATEHGISDDKIIYGALCYELANVIARHSRSFADAHFIIASVCQAMRSQVNRFGVGHEHP